MTYDALNRKLSESVNYGPFSKTYSYTYDARGNKASYTSPEGVVYSYAYNLNNQPTSISFGANTIALNYQWNRLVSSTLPNGITTDYQYNANSWLTYITAEQGAATLSEYNYSFDNVGNITNKNTEHGNYSYSYDETYQLTNSISPSLQEPFTYDNTGNRLTDSSTLSNLSFGTTEYIYNSRNRLERVTLPDGRTALYTYDPFGRRIKKDVTGQVTYYAYSDEGLIGEYDSIGNISKAYGWKPDGMWNTAPVFMVEGSNYFFYQNDHLGTPQKLTDINGNTVWSATYTGFGKAEVQIANIENNLRFPGQYYDEETELHYNWNRYYNSKMGRYISKDPIGFRGGKNQYSYINQNPINGIDPLGLYGTTDFVLHYYAGGGTAIDLSDVGLLSSFKRSTSVYAATSSFKKAAHNAAKSAGKALCKACDDGKKTSKFSFKDTTITDVTSEPDLFAVGHSTFFRSATCLVNANCKNKTFDYSCSLGFSIKDKFKDPLSLGIEAGGTIYDINASWSDKLTGKGSW